MFLKPNVKDTSDTINEQIKSCENKSTNFFEKFLFVYLLLRLFCSCFRWKGVSIKGCFPDSRSRFRFSVFEGDSIFGRRSWPRPRGCWSTSRREEKLEGPTSPTPTPSSSGRGPKLRFRLLQFRSEICLLFLKGEKKSCHKEKGD